MEFVLVVGRQSWLVFNESMIEYGAQIISTESPTKNKKCYFLLKTQEKLSRIVEWSDFIFFSVRKSIVFYRAHWTPIFNSVDRRSKQS